MNPRPPLRVTVAPAAAVAAALLAAVLLLAGCGATVPADPGGTLDGVRRSGTLRAGASPADGLVDVSGDRPRGPEAELVEEYADSLGAQVRWTVGGEEHLVTLIEDGRLDLAVGGLTRDNAWSTKVALTRAYAGSHVLMVPMGENALLSDLERFLDDHAAAAYR